MKKDILKRVLSYRADEVKRVPLESIIRVMRGVHTDVFRAAGLIDPLCCLSIETADRTVDIQFPSVIQRESCFKALRAIIEDNSLPSIEFI